MPQTGFKPTTTKFLGQCSLCTCRGTCSWVSGYTGSGPGSTTTHCTAHSPLGFHTGLVTFSWQHISSQLHAELSPHIPPYSIRSRLRGRNCSHNIMRYTCTYDKVSSTSCLWELASPLQLSAPAIIKWYCISCWPQTCQLTVFVCLL